ncbi:hypothetical protein HRbin15_01066 [bacterium HR15]|nr:hypothetical protein HRbin15_01066 [bacterium HR15]
MKVTTVCVLTRDEILRDLIKTVLGQYKSIRIVDRLDPGPIDVVISEDPLFSPTEVEVLRQLVRLGCVERVADTLCRSPRTIHRVLANIREKLGVANTLQAVLWAIRMGVVRV